MTLGVMLDIYRMKIVATESDIKTYIVEKMASNNTFMKQIDQRLEEQIIETVVNWANGM